MRNRKGGEIPFSPSVSWGASLNAITRIITIVGETPVFSWRFEGMSSAGPNG